MTGCNLISFTLKRISVSGELLICKTSSIQKIYTQSYFYHIPPDLLEYNPHNCKCLSFP